jgi:hypothetical protein
MQVKTIFILIVSFFFSMQVYSQKLPVARNIQAAYTKGSRSENGGPGKNYWQNTASYDLHINFDPATRFLSGTETIDYVNNSPDTLKQIVFKLYPNLYKKGTPRTMPVKAQDLTDGVAINSFLINNNPVDTSKLQINGTNMIVRNARVLPSQLTEFSISWSYTLNKGSHIRTGEIDPGADFVAYFFPRIAVYDDIDGWNTYAYNGTQEFYNDFCHFKAAITVPNQEVVWATGNLDNAPEVLSNKSYQRLQQAEKTDAVTTIIDSTDYADATNRTKATNTWNFEADNVTDFVFACSDHYMWYSSSLVVDKTTGRRTRVDAAFNPQHKDYFNVINDARKTVEAMSYTFPKWPYPYPHETVFDGLDQMEYPMMVNDNPLENKTESIELTDHEIFHTMFPFYMGINETKYAWMDEGWATIGEWIISPIIDSSIVDEYGIAGYEALAGKESDPPIITLSTEETVSYYNNSYGKPAMGYLYVKDMLGDSLFTKALHYYIQQWHGKHPVPYDFFNCMNVGSGKNLDWFWKAWFFDKGFPDLAITSVKNNGKASTVVITSKGLKPVPVDLSITYTDNTTSHLHKAIDVWEKGNKAITIVIPGSKKIRSIHLGDPHTPDVNQADNNYEVK